MAFSDDIGATPGTGATFRALVDAVTGVLWPPELAAYAATISAGANVLQVVSPDFPLPVTDQRGDDRLQILLRMLMQGEELQLLDSMILEAINQRGGAECYDTDQIVIGTTPTLVVQPRATRRLLTLLNIGTVSISLIGDGKLAARGVPIAAGASAQTTNKGAIRMIITGGTVTGTVAYWEEFD